MAHDMVLKNALVVAPSGVFHGGVAIDGAEIVALGASSTLGAARREIDLDGKLLLPGLYDPHVHVGVCDRIGEESMVEHFLHSTKDCLVGGVTTIATTSLLGRSPLPELFAQALRCGRDHSWCDFKVTSVVGTAEQARQIPVVAQQGGVSFKFFTGYIGEQAASFGMDPEGITPALFHQACEQLRRCGAPTFPKIHPPIRFEKDRERLWRGIQEGTISVVGTDSLCYSASFKTEADFWDCRVGINLQVADTLALLYDEGVNHGRIDLPMLARVLSENAAKLYGLYPRKGAIAVGADADLVVLDPERETTLGVSRMRSRADYSLWEGRRVRGIPVMTLLRGELVMQDGEIVGERPTGRFVAQVVRPQGLG